MLVFYLATIAVAILIVIGAAALLPPLAELSIETRAVEPSVVEGPAIAGRLIEMVPINPFQALAEGNVFQIIVFALLLGAGTLMIGKKGQEFGALITAFAEVMLKVTVIVMELAPFGVLALMAVTVATYGTEAIGSLLALVLVFYAACIFHMVITYGGILHFFLRLEPLRFFHGVVDAQVVAFSTASSSATLPTPLSPAVLATPRSMVLATTPITSPP